MEWNGQDIGPIEPYDCGEYILFLYRGETYAATPRPRRDPELSCILDELKYIFAAPKIGTVRAYIRGKRVVLERTLLDDKGNLIVPSQIDLDRPLSRIAKGWLRNSLIFRDILGVTTRSYSRFLQIGDTILSVDEVSLAETTGSIYSKRLTKLRDLAFEDYVQEVRQLLGISTAEDIIEYQALLTSLMEPLICRIDRSKIWLIDRARNRVQDLLS